MENVQHDTTSSIGINKSGMGRGVGERGGLEWSMRKESNSPIVYGVLVLGSRIKGEQQIRVYNVIRI